MKRCLLSFLVLLQFRYSFSQITDSLPYYLSYAATGTINKTENSRSYVFSNGVAASINKRKVSVNSNFSWIYGEVNRSTTNNDFSAAVDFNYRNDSNSKHVFWALATYDKSYSLKINHRGQFGVGVSYDLIRIGRNRLNISDGILYENSDLMLMTDVHDKYSTWRNSFRLKYVFNITQVVSISGTHFVQNSFSEIADYNIKSNSALMIRLYKSINFTTALLYNKLNRIKKENLLVTLGLSIQKKF